MSSDAYEELRDRYAGAAALESARGVLYWDQQTKMPSGGTPARSKQLSALSSAHHERLTDERVGELLADLADADLADEEAAVVREVRREYERAAEVPRDLVERLTAAQSDAQETWQDAKANDDFDAFAPTLEELRELHVERAGHVDPDSEPYTVMHEDSLPYIDLDTVESVFADLREALVPLIERIEAEGRDLANPFSEGEYPEDDQMELSERVLDAVGYPEDRGRLDLSPHPFTAGNQFDCRVTTRFKEDPVKGFMATLHEYGHGQYNLGLPQEEFGSPLGMALGSGVHESQSRFWENHVGRTKAFWEGYLPEVTDVFPHLGDATPQEAYEGVNRIYPNNTIRVEADELTYHMHIILRFETGREFVRGEIDAADIPAVWNDRMDEYLGVVPETDSEGCLQDIHWSSRFAAFQGYTIGSVLAAQLDAAMREDLDDVDGKIRRGEFAPLREWMTENVHRHGRRYPSDELIERATGEPLTADYFVDYVEEKFEALYDL